ncbi:MAG: CHAT domain-containing protein, partial [Elainellaceae cyanobacterium]
MAILHLDLKAVSGETVELRCFGDNPNDYDERSLQLSEIQDLVDQAETNHYVSQRFQEELTETGRRLYDWLDGDQRWLATKLTQHPGEEIVLAIATAERLAHLPWEVLHDGAQFLVQRLPAVVPVRWASSDSAGRLTVDPDPQNRALRVLFMATSPEGVEPVLDYEQEEGAILTAATRPSVELVVEETGNLEELQQTVDDYGKDGGKGSFDVAHLTGHATLKDGEPRFVTETAEGLAHYAAPEEIAKSLRLPLPKLVFVSGCRTGQAGNAGAVPSMAEQLLTCGAAAVLGWGQTVLDTDATAAAARLHTELSRGRSLTSALAETVQEMIKQERRDWYLLRLYVGQRLPGELVTSPRTRGWKRAPKPTVTTEFLDPKTKQIKVPGREGFVGRRRQLQRCLRALKDPEKMGVLVHGMGGLGKSSLAARLCDRLPDFKRIVISGRVAAAKLVKALADGVDDKALRDRLKNPDEALKYRLRGVFEQLQEDGAKPFLLVLDDFEQNLEARGGGYVLRPWAVEPLRDLLWAIEEAYAPHKLILTSRYDFEFGGWQWFYKQPLDALAGADLRKKRGQLKGMTPPLLGDEATEAEVQAAQEKLEQQQRAARLADGNPRLLETLDEALQAEANPGERLAALEADPSELRRQVLEERVLSQMDEAGREMLARGLMFELSVPPGVFGRAADGAEAIEQAVTLGLLEVSPDGSLRVPRLLPLEMPEITEELYGEAATALYEQWWRNEAFSATETQTLEVYRLTKLANQDEQASEVGNAIGIAWEKRGRYRDAIPVLEESLTMRQRCFGNAHPDVATSLNNLAYLYGSQG